MSKVGRVFAAVFLIALGAQVVGACVSTAGGQRVWVYEAGTWTEGSSRLSEGTDSPEAGPGEDDEGEGPGGTPPVAGAGPPIPGGNQCPGRVGRFDGPFIATADFCVAAAVGCGIRPPQVIDRVCKNHAPYAAACTARNACPPANPDCKPAGGAIIGRGHRLGCQNLGANATCPRATPNLCHCAVNLPQRGVGFDCDCSCQ